MPFFIFLIVAGTSDRRIKDDLSEVGMVRLGTGVDEGKEVVGRSSPLLTPL